MSTYVPIQAITLSSAVASVTFTGIPQTYTDLVLVSSAQRGITGSGGAGTMILNGDTGTNYSSTILYNDGNTAYSFRWSSASALNAAFSAGDGSYAVSIINIMNYSNNTTRKTINSRFGFTGTNGRSVIGSNLWRNTAPITEITLLAANNIASGSTFTLYGVGAGSPKAMGGTTVVSDGTYWYHAFASSGRFEPVQNLNCDILVVAGGGSGGASSGGGGGAGGLLTYSSQSLTAQNYTVTIGAGGASTINTAVSNNGSNSSFGSLAAAIGGGGGGNRISTQQNGLNGGSGGGGAVDGYVGGTGTAGQGNDGGDSPGAQNPGGGGGGAGAAGQDGGSANPSGGDGGIGATSTLITSLGNAVSAGVLSSGSRYFAGGGGGSYNTSGTGEGGLGGGGANGGANNSNGQNGLANTGGGGGAATGVSSTYSSGAGGSGIVIIRYAV